MTVLDMKASTKFFLDRPAVIKRLGAENAKILRQFGFDHRDLVKKSIKPAKMKTLAEMSDDERQTYDIRKRIAKDEGRKAPKRPKASSKPGEAPRSQTGLLRKLQLFALDPTTESVVSGYGKLNAAEGQNVPETLEYGGNGIAARPAQFPAFQQLLPSLPSRFRDRF